MDEKACNINQKNNPPPKINNKIYTAISLLFLSFLCLRETVDLICLDFNLNDISEQSGMDLSRAIYDGVWTKRCLSLRELGNSLPMQAAPHTSTQTMYTRQHFWHNTHDTPHTYTTHMTPSTSHRQHRLLHTSLIAWHSASNNLTTCTGNGRMCAMTSIRKKNMWG